MAFEQIVIKFGGMFCIVEKQIKHSMYTKYSFIDIFMFNKLYT